MSWVRHARARFPRLAIVAAILTSAWMLSGVASAQEQRDCADFDSQEAAQAFYDEHKDDDPNDRDPYNLDTDGDGKACEGLPTSSIAAAAAAPRATQRPAPADRSLPKNGISSAVLALSGLSLLELGYALTLAAKRLRVRRRAVPLYLMRRLADAAKRGEDAVHIADDVYVVRRSVLEQRTLGL